MSIDPTPNPDRPFDAIIVGGSYAGLQAAMLLARARQRILVIDAGQRRNRFASASHGLLGRDGMEPGAIAAEGKAQLLAYPDVQWLDASAVYATGSHDNFLLRTDAGHELRARRLVLALGVVDELPPVEGLRERWGRSVFHCPYCHGFELQQGRIGVLANGELSMHHALMLPDWGQVTLLTNDTFVPSVEQTVALAERGVAIVTGAVDRISGIATVEMADGRTLDFDGLFAATRIRIASPLPEQLGCEFEDTPMGAIIRTDALKATTVPGVFACGDAARMMHSVPLALGDGALAGVATHRSLLFD
ncbi:NAD(P)/FAD-dependent oxidoreductase [Massilia arenosa]|uniref:NAD(P)/FAD-dependent oxidoreductase n=1 Tax=Zemynaea arenosa TaxID=2561931 RepID=A0A4Y9SNY0_9BURK|nr:NAD(P)/FAD-dependent oxidoreductase [Massilia arenosa]TFW25018.1 NAD(P)/FAD-dependent oxidoreductase [Massilia arenosa]